MDIIKFLLENGAEIDAKDNSGKNSLHLAAENGNLNICELFRKYSLIALIAGSANAASILIKNGAQMNAKTYLDETPVFKAIEHCNLIIFFLAVRTISLNFDEFQNYLL